MNVVSFMYSSIFVVTLSESLYFVTPKGVTVKFAPENTLQRHGMPNAASIQQTLTLCQFSHHRPLVNMGEQAIAQRFLPSEGRSRLSSREDEEGEVEVVGNNPPGDRSLVSFCLAQEKTEAGEERSDARQQGDLFLTRSSQEQSAKLLSSLFGGVQVQQDRVSVLDAMSGREKNGEAAIAARAEPVQDFFWCHNRSQARGGVYAMAKAHNRSSPHGSAH